MRPYAELLDGHIAACQRLYNRFSIDLGETPADVAALPTAMRPATYQEQVKNGPAVDRELEALLYQDARSDLDMQWKAGMLAAATIRGISSSSPKCMIRYGKQTKVLIVPMRRHVDLTAKDFE